MLLCNFTRLSKKTFHTFISILILLQSISAFSANELDLDSDGIENQFDAFETNAAASVDNDKDGFPDEWNSTCLAQCQVDSGLIQDSFLNDTDNDGVPNDIDSDLANDNGKPTLLTAPKEIHATVNADDGSGIIINSIDIDNLVAQISAVDAVDQPSMLTPKAYLNNIELIPNEAGVVILPSGFHIISWVVVDRSGNESDSLEQFVYIYPRVRFNQLTSLSGEGRSAKVTLSLSGDSPVYPVQIDVQVNGILSSAVQADIDASFDISDIHSVVIEGTNLEKQASIEFSIVEDYVNEMDELLVFEVAAVESVQGRSDLFIVDEPRSRHELIITEDFDHDGIPDFCSQTCLALGMQADSDSDNDGIDNVRDAFEFNAAASVDADNDGQPDAWAETCLVQCQTDSGLIRDSLLNDTDNDGATNDVDTDYLNDNGKPVLLTVPQDMHVAVNTIDGKNFIVDTASIEALVAQLSGEDVIDDPSLLTAKAYLNDVWLVPDENGEVILPSGSHTINWVAVDSSGNESEPKAQLVFIYPKVRFTSSISIMGEKGLAKIAVELSGDSPDYPVVINLQVNGLMSSVVQSDLGIDFDLTAIPPLIIEGPDAGLKTQILLPIIEDNLNEPDELLVFDIESLDNTKGHADLFVIDKQRSRHALTITEDFDHDGLPNVCNQVCQELGLVADLDNDNDGIENELDAFEFNAAASVDADNDGQPDVWAETCLAQCQADSGLVQDPILNDTDNDGAPNDIDTDFERDNGKPILLTVPDTIHVAVNTVDGDGVIVDADAVNWHVAQLLAEDVIDSAEELTAKAYLNNVELIPDENGEVILPAGLLAINWVAVDTSGNESEPLIQLVYVYPKVRFKSITSMVGEASEADIIVELTGDSPEYPVAVELQVNGILSSIVQDDLGENFDLSATHTIVIEQGDDPEMINREGHLRVSIIDDNISENDEYLVVELKSVMGIEQSTHEYIVLAKQDEAHELIVTYRNLAPTVELLVLQNNQAVNSIALDGGQVSLVAIVSDSNGSDRHTYSWNLDGIVVDDLTGGSIVFEPSDFDPREYQISVTVTDNGSNPLSGVASQKLTLLTVEEPQITEPPVIESPTEPSSGEAEASDSSSGGGAMAWMLLLLMSLAVVGQDRRYTKIEKHLS